MLEIIDTSWSRSSSANPVAPETAPMAWEQKGIGCLSRREGVQIEAQGAGYTEVIDLLPVYRRELIRR